MGLLTENFFSDCCNKKISDNLKPILQIKYLMDCDADKVGKLAVLSDGVHFFTRIGFDRSCLYDGKLDKFKLTKYSTRLPVIKLIKWSYRNLKRFVLKLIGFKNFEYCRYDVFIIHDFDILTDNEQIIGDPTNYEFCRNQIVNDNGKRKSSNNDVNESPVKLSKIDVKISDINDKMKSR